MNKIHPAARIISHQERIERLHQEVAIREDQIIILRAEMLAEGE